MRNVPIGLGCLDTWLPRSAQLFRIDVTEETQAIRNEEMTDTGTGKSGSGGLRTLMEMHQQPGNSVCLLYRAE